MTRQQAPLLEAARTDVALSPSLEPNRDTLKAMETWNVMMDELYQESLGFMAMRVEKDGEAFRQAVTCPSLQDFLTFHMQWADEGLHDYSAELTKILAICTKHGADAIQRPLH